MAPLTEEEFRTWHTVPAAVERLGECGFDTETARKAILGGLRTDGIDSAAEVTRKLSRVPNKQNVDLPFAPMRSPHWSVDTPAESFWNDGNADLRKKGVKDFDYRHEGIRFRPADIDKLGAEKRGAGAQDVVTVAGSVEELPPEPSEEEFADWLPPASVLGLLTPQLGQQGAVDEVVARLLADRIRAAGSTNYPHEGETIKDERAPIPPSWWKYAQVNGPNDLFWRSGTVTFSPPGKSTRPTKSMPFFGVRLEREGIYQILDASGIERPPRERPQYRRGVPAGAVIPQESQPPPLTQEVFESWEPAAGALRRFDGLSDQDVLDSLWARLASGLVVAAAETAEIDGRPEHRKLLRIPTVWWPQTPALKNVHHGLWQHGQAPLSYIAHSTNTRTSTLKTAQLFNVRFESSGFRDIVQPGSRFVELAGTASGDAAPVQEGARRGPKVQPYWEPMWAAIAARFARDEIRGMTEAQIARAMQKWLADEQHYPADSTVRIRADALVKALKLLAGNSKS